MKKFFLVSLMLVVFACVAYGAVLSKDTELILLEISHFSDRIDWMQHTIYWGLAGLGILITVYAFLIAILTLRKDNAPQQQPIINVPAPTAPIIVVKNSEVESVTEKV